MHVLIVGDSHTGALERGRALLEEHHSLPEGIDWRIVPLGTGARMNTQFWLDAGTHAELIDKRYVKAMGKLPPDNPRPDAIGLSMPLWSGRVMRAIFDSEARPAGVEGRGRVLSSALVRRLVLADMHYTMGLGRFLADQGMPVFVIEPPRAFSAYRYVQSLGAAQVLAQQKVIRDIQRAEVDAAGFPVVTMPADAVGADGFMLEEHAHEDPADKNHANAMFGATMILRTAALVRQMLAPATSVTTG